MWKEVKRIIQKYDYFLITTHQNPDGDGVGAAAALIEFLLARGKKVKFVCDPEVPKRLAFLDYHGLFDPFDDNATYSDVQVVIVLDTHRLDRIGRLAHILKRQEIVSVCIDHHVCNKPFTPWTFIDTEACSVGAMIYTLCKESGFDLNLRTATGIYTSIICDTGRFSYSSTSRKAHKLADECLKLGVDPNEMHANLFQQVSLDQARIFSKAIQRMEFYHQNRLVVQEIRKEDYIENKEFFQDLEYFHEFNKAIRDVECTVVLCETPANEVRVSVRSKFSMDIEKPMRSMGGGGHSKAAGASWKGSLKEVKQMVLSLLGECFSKQDVNCQEDGFNSHAKAS